MMLRKTRWLTAGLLAAVALLESSPTTSQAGIQVLIRELDSGGNAVGVDQYFTGAINSGITTASFQNIAITVGSSSGVPSAFNSMNTTVNMRPSGTFDPSHSLRVWVTDDGFINTFVGQPALLQNTAGASSGIGGGQNTVSSNSRIVAAPAVTPTTLQPSPNDDLTTDTLLGPATLNATSVSPGGGISPETISGIGALPSVFAIQQTINIRATPFPGQSINPNSTLGGTFGSQVLSNTPVPGVPAPAGIVLALIGLPLVAARRLRNKKA